MRVEVVDSQVGPPATGEEPIRLRIYLADLFRHAELATRTCIPRQSSRGLERLKALQKAIELEVAFGHTSRAHRRGHARRTVRALSERPQPRPGSSQRPPFFVLQSFANWNVPLWVKASGAPSRELFSPPSGRVWSFKFIQDHSRSFKIIVFNKS